MSANDFRLDLEYPVDPNLVFEQLATEKGIQNWWTSFCHMKEGPGGWATFRFDKRGFYAVVNILSLEPGQLLEWEVFESKHPDSSGFKNLRDWIGTKIRFEIQPDGKGGSKLIMVHEGLAPLESYESSSKLWSFYLDQSLRKYLTTGKGEPYLSDDK